MKSVAKKLSFLLLPLLLGVAAFPGCAQAPQEEDFHLDLADPSVGIVSAYDLIAFFETGTSDTAVLSASIDLDDAMLKLTAARGPVTIQGNGFSITSNADCVVRLEDGCRISMTDLELIGGADGIGCLGSASILAQNVTVNAITTAIYCDEALTIRQNSVLNANGSMGSGVVARHLVVERDARVAASGAMSAVKTTKNDIILMENASLRAATKENYNAVKCAGTLRMMDGSTFDVENSGLYHGAELDGLDISGVVNITAKAGDKGVGLFIFTMKENLYVVGSCTPAPRFENGKGSITFVGSAAQIPEPEIQAGTETEAAAEEEQ